MKIEYSHTAYFDASGDRAAPLLTVVGYISTAQDWKDFDSEWNDALVRAKVPYFHRKKFIANRTPFNNKKWEREETRKAFLSELIDVLAHNVDYAAINILETKDWEAINQEYCMDETRLSPFATVGCMAITGVYEWCKAHGVPYEHVEIIFEHGDTGRGDLMHWSEKCWGRIPIFRKKTSDEVEIDFQEYPLTPLQGCDFLAGEIGRAEKDAIKAETNAETLEFRGCFIELMKRISHDDEHGKWSRDNLRGLCEKHKIERRK